MSSVPPTAKILIVEDEVDLLRTLEYNFRQAGFDVLTTARGRDALRLVADQAPALVLLDLMLPDLAGTEVCRQIKADAKQGVGQSLARLLNVTDGIVGQGLHLLVAITTNEPVHELHPAVVRPGRCLAEIFVPRLSRLEAARWLGRAAALPPDGVTLAELFLLRGQLRKVEGRPTQVAAGQYL